MLKPKRPMTPLTLSAYTLVTANGRGIGAVYQALRERRSGLKPCDFEDALLKTYIGRVAGWKIFSRRGFRAIRVSEQSTGLAGPATGRVHGRGGRSDPALRRRPDRGCHGHQYLGYS